MNELMACVEITVMFLTIPIILYGIIRGLSHCYVEARDTMKARYVFGLFTLAILLACVIIEIVWRSIAIHQIIG